jgi:hypothetical protein
MRRHEKNELDVVIVYRNFKVFNGISHVGLGISATNNAKVLNRIGIKTRVVPIVNPEDLVVFLAKLEKAPTHIILQAPWIPAQVLGNLAAEYHDTQFAVVCHSNIGFLQVEPAAINLMKQYIELEGETSNFHVAGNNHRFCQWLENTFSQPCTLLPNLYFLQHKQHQPKRIWNDIGGTLRIGLFGATRLQKNILSGVGAAMEIANELGAKTEIWINGGRNDGGKDSAETIRRSIRNLTDGMPNIVLRELNWASWDQFKRVVGTMNLLVQASYSESFNIVTADGVSEGVASVVSSAIDWAPQSWQADVDDADDIARVGIGILNDPEAAVKGLESLKKHNKVGEMEWAEFLVQNKFGRVL